MEKIISFMKHGEDEHSFEVLVLPHLEALQRQAYQYTGIDHDAEDLVQELLVDIYQKKTLVSKVKNTKAWLFRCLFNRFVDKYRRVKAGPNFENIQESESETWVDSEKSPEKDYWHGQVIDSLNSLSPSQKTAICLHDIAGYTVGEISSMTKVPVGTLKSHIHRGRNVMKRKFASLKKECSMLEITG